MKYRSNKYISPFLLWTIIDIASDQLPILIILVWLGYFLPDERSELAKDPFLPLLFFFHKRSGRISDHLLNDPKTASRCILRQLREDVHEKSISVHIHFSPRGPVLASWGAVKIMFFSSYNSKLHV